MIHLFSHSTHTHTKEIGRKGRKTWGEERGKVKGERKRGGQGGGREGRKQRN